MWKVYKSLEDYLSKVHDYYFSMLHDMLYSLKTDIIAAIEEFPDIFKGI